MENASNSTWDSHEKDLGSIPEKKFSDLVFLIKEMRKLGFDKKLTLHYSFDWLIVSSQKVNEPLDISEPYITMACVDDKIHISVSDNRAEDFWTENIELTPQIIEHLERLSRLYNS